MTENLIATLVLLSPVAFAICALASWFQPGGKPSIVKSFSSFTTIFTIVIAAVSGFFILQNDAVQTMTIGFYEIGLSLRLDPLSILMFSMIALLGFIIVKFSFNYLDGDQRQGAFLGRLCATIASVQLLVLSGNLGLLFLSWVLTSISLHRLLVFYSDRPRAIIAAKKKFIMARAGDLSLFIAFVLLYNHFGTGDLGTIFQQIKENQALQSNFANVELAGVFLALAAIFKSAQFPFHGWLIEVMETPTPVSALLHAGLLNAGPFLITRFAFVVEGTTLAPVILIIFGGFTGWFASVAFLTQPSVKTALGYSSVAHMGFMLMICGLGVYPAAMLHLVAHSFYKAHAFLSSGSVIDTVRSNKVALPERLGSIPRLLLSVFLAMAVYLAFSFAWGIDPLEELSLLATGAIIVMGLSQMLAPTIDANGFKSGILRTTIMATLVAAAFFTLESATHLLLATQLPTLSQPNMIITVLIAGVLLLYGITVVGQMLAPSLATSSYWTKVGFHFRNGWYANAILDRLVGALNNSSSGTPQPNFSNKAFNIPTEENPSDKKPKRESVLESV
ncbi:NADH/ubiquinone/plastoquinone (complex i) [Galbibacter sp. BG1]|uniref:proton-conducting transporter transmembrane domain-containing protein n=1 Tax=Galbibacter sp. BG1 TaxID=1170699 RepID=UPI0015B79A59|nr:proton-conducting transporter membrane subunit [Galbibacter sp. BG1]QLE01198.1 NADH/ubiquinone/plastoquinone (complex i) [Galbibacter sp. BG1]